MYTDAYGEVKRQFARNNPCPDCGKKVRRQRTFSQTINPWNKTGEGADRHVKTRDEIWDELAASGAKWQAEPETCSKCEASAEAAAEGRDA